MRLKYSIIVLVIFSFLFYSCYSYTEITHSDFKRANAKGNYKVITKDHEIYKFKIDSIDYSNDLIVTKDSIKNIKFADIENIYREHFDVVQTVIIVPVVLIASLALLYIFLILSSDVGG